MDGFDRMDDLNRDGELSTFERETRDYNRYLELSGDNTMDGVLADFDRGIREFCGMEPASQGEEWPPGDDMPMWAKASKVPHFYDKLELMPGAKEMFERVYGKYDRYPA